MSYLGRTVNCFPALSACIVLYDNVEGIPQEISFEIRSSSNNLNPVTKCGMPSAIGVYLKPLSDNQKQHPQSTLFENHLDYHNKPFQRRFLVLGIGVLLV